MEELEKRVGKVENRVTALETAKPYMEDLMKRSIKVNEELSNTMVEVKDAMIELKTQIKGQDERLRSMEIKINKLNEKVDIVEDEGKFSIVGWLKKEWPWIVVIIGVGALYVSKFVKF